MRSGCARRSRPFFSSWKRVIERSGPSSLILHPGKLLLEAIPAILHNGLPWRSARSAVSVRITPYVPVARSSPDSSLSRNAPFGDTAWASRRSPSASRGRSRCSAISPESIRTAWATSWRRVRFSFPGSCRESTTMRKHREASREKQMPRPGSHRSGSRRSPPRSLQAGTRSGAGGTGALRFDATDGFRQSSRAL
jgi:hypothetical protein